MSVKFPYLNYYFSAKTKYKVHSPFVFEFMNEVFEDERYYHFFGVIENYRRNLLNIADKLTINGQQKRVSQLVGEMEISPKIGEILFKAVHLYKPETLLEIGTNLGISTLYQATPNPNVLLITLEENKFLAQQTRAYFERLGTHNVVVQAGPIAQNLKKVLKKMPSLEFIFFNKSSDTEVAISYFEHCIPKLLPNSVVVLRNPYKNSENIAFWNYLKKQEATKLSIDIYDLGFIFFRSEQRNVEYFQLIEAWKKPWAIY